MLLSALPLAASEPSSRNLDAGWQFRAVANADRSDVKEWHAAQVPGVVQTDLLRSGLIPDPFDRDNEFHLQWIGLAVQLAGGAVILAGIVIAQTAR